MSVSLLPITLTHHVKQHWILQCSCSAADVIYDNVDIDANIIFGALVDDRITNGEVITYNYIV